jgi:hypothetical protein
MRAWIRAPFDGEIISPKIARHSDTIDNVKAKIDNVKAKIQDKEEGRPWSRPTLARCPVSGQLAASLTSSPLEGPPRQVSVSHDKSPPRMRSPAPAGAWAQTHSASASTDVRGGTVPHATQIQQLAAMQAARPDKGLNAGLTGCATITSPSSPALPHASSARGTQAPSTTHTSLDLGEYSSRPRQAQTARARGQASRGEQSSPATWRLPRQGVTTQLQCASTDSNIRQDVPTAKHCNSFFFPLVPLPLRL